jgi:LPS export ABC transporter protein LptC
MRVVGIAAVILLVAALVAAVYLKEERNKTKQLKIIPDHVDIQVKNVVYTDVGAEGVKWEVRAATGTYLRKENKALFDKVTIKMVLPSGRTFVMKGDKGVLGTESKDMNITGNVTLLSDQGDRVTMNDLHYTDADKVFKTDSPVFHENDRIKVQGKGMVLSLATREMKILSAVKATIKPK